MLSEVTPQRRNGAPTRLKSSAANVGAGAVVGLASEIESAAASGEVEAVRTILPGLEGAYSQAIADLETIMDGIEATG